MAAPTPYILIHSAFDTIVTRLGVFPEASTEPVMINSVRANATLATARLEDKYGDLYAEAWGNRTLVYAVSLDQLAQYGLSDSYLGRFDTTLLANLSLNFGIDPANGVALLTQGSRELEPAKLAKVSLTIKVEDTRNAGQGSPDGPSTPAWGSTPAGTRPAITTTSPQAGTIGTAFSLTLAATGTATIVFTLAPGQTLPAGLSFAAPTISGTPTGVASQTWVEVRASNGYGTASKTIQISIAAAAVAPPTPVQVYVRYVWDSDSAVIPDGRWALAYGGMATLPASEAAFYAETPTTVSSPAASPALPADPGARTGATAGHDWEITEILAWNGTAYVYLYQKTSADTALLDAINAGASDVLLTASEPYTVTIDIGTVGPGDPTPPSWPGVIIPSTRLTQYYAVKDYASPGEPVTVTGLGGDKIFGSVAALLGAHQNLSLNWTETRQQVLVEVYNNDSSPAYLYQQATTDTRISTKLALTDSPIFYAGDRPGVRGSTSLPEPLVAFTPVALPAAPATHTGPAPDVVAWCYVIERLWAGGERQCYGYRANAPTTLTLERFLAWTGKLTSRASHDEMTYGQGWLEEIWINLTPVATPTAWTAYFLDASLTAATSLIGGCLADVKSPINNDLVAPGQLYSVPASTTPFI